MYWNATEWNKEGTARVTSEQYANTTAFVQDGSDYAAYLYTLPSHQCSMHEDKS
jgi:hypothetical protein